MLDFILADGKIKFTTHIIEWSDTNKKKCYSIEQKDLFVANLTKKNIDPNIIELELPSTELLLSCKDKIFTSYDEALAFINGTYEEPITVESLAEIISDIIGGAIVVG